MKSILLQNWSFRRILFLGIGLIIGIDSIQKMEWMGVIFGAYFIVMGIFQIGCAARNCVVPTKHLAIKNEDEVVSFEEVKLKN